MKIDCYEGKKFNSEMDDIMHTLRCLLSEEKVSEIEAYLREANHIIAEGVSQIRTASPEVAKENEKLKNDVQKALERWRENVVCKIDLSGERSSANNESQLKTEVEELKREVDNLKKEISVMKKRDESVNRRCRR